MELAYSESESGSDHEGEQAVEEKPAVAAPIAKKPVVAAAPPKKKLPSPADLLLKSSGKPSFLQNTPEHFVASEIKAPKRPAPDREAQTISSQPVSVGGLASDAPKIAPAVPLPEWGQPKAKQAKKDKSKESFNSKEKRKRDMGQSSRGKSWVEEEKRILRQAGCD